MLSARTTQDVTIPIDSFPFGHFSDDALSEGGLSAAEFQTVGSRNETSPPQKTRKTVNEQLESAKNGLGL